MLRHLSRLSVRAQFSGAARALAQQHRGLGALSLRDDGGDWSVVGGRASYGQDFDEESTSSRPGANDHHHWLRESIGAVSGRFIQSVECPLIVGTPYTLEGALAPSSQCRYITEAKAPYRITHVNHAWEELCGYSEEEVIGKSGLKFLQGPATNQGALEKLNQDIKSGRRGCADLINYRKDGHPFLHKLQVSPLIGKTGEVEYLLGVFKKVD